MFLSRYLKSKELWREDPSPRWVVHQGQNAVNTRQPVDGPKEVNAVPLVTRVLAHRLHLLQILIVHSASACIPETDTGFVSVPGRPPPELLSGDAAGNDPRTSISSLFQLQGCIAQADPQPGHAEQELCMIFLSVGSLSPGETAQESEFCFSLLRFAFPSPRFRAQQRVLEQNQQQYNVNLGTRGSAENHCQTRL